MCGSTKAPPVVKDDPIKDNAEAQAKATAKTNAEIAQRRKRRLDNSLLTIGPAGTAGMTDTPQTLLASFDDRATPSPGSLLGGGDLSRMGVFGSIAGRVAGVPQSKLGG